LLGLYNLVSILKCRLSTVWPVEGGDIIKAFPGGVVVFWCPSITCQRVVANEGFFLGVGYYKGLPRRCRESLV